MKGLLLSAASLFLAICGIVWLVEAGNYNREVNDYLLKAARASSILEIRGDLDTAITNIQKRGLTEGSTQGITPQGLPDSNITVWYQDISKAHQMADLLLISIRGREKTITAVQRDSLVAEMDVFFRAARISEQEAYAPLFISIYPNQGVIVILGGLSLIVFLLAGGICICSRE